MHIDISGLLLACRHGHSVGNAARADAEQRGLLELETGIPDTNFRLTQAGRQQARELGRYIATLPQSRRPTRIVCSPSLRAVETAECILGQLSGERIGFSTDSRLRPKSFGLLARLTRKGEALRFPHLVAHRQRVGRFHFCPPGGESRCDVVLRVRDFINEWRERGNDRCILVVSHQVVMNALTYLLTPATANAMAMDVDGPVENAQLFSYHVPRSLPIEKGLTYSPMVRPLAIPMVAETTP